MNGRVFNDRFHQLPLVGSLRGYRSADIARIATAWAEGGLTNMEVTMNSDDAPGQIRAAIAAVGDRMNVGAGTVTTLERLDAALEAGASFIVTPAVIPEVIERCVAAKTPVIPGAFTPTEVWSAWRAGALMVKLFPAELGGPVYARALKGPFPEIPLMATGGVNTRTMGDYLDAGVEGFGLGSSICAPERVAAGDWAWLTDQARRHCQIFRASRGV